MANKRCPYCGSLNTEVSLGNYATRGIINAGRGTIAMGAGLVGSLFNHAAGHHAANQVLKSTDPGELKGHHCKNCGRDFSAKLL